jgi:hypothetical protein
METSRIKPSKFISRWVSTMQSCKLPKAALRTDPTVIKQNKGCSKKNLRLCRRSFGQSYVGGRRSFRAVAQMDSTGICNTALTNRATIFQQKLSRYYSTRKILIITPRRNNRNTHCVQKLFIIIGTSTPHHYSLALFTLVETACMQISR